MPSNIQQSINSMIGSVAQVGGLGQLASHLRAQTHAMSPEGQIEAHEALRQQRQINARDELQRAKEAYTTWEAKPNKTAEDQATGDVVLDVWRNAARRAFELDPSQETYKELWNVEAGQVTAEQERYRRQQQKAFEEQQAAKMAKTTSFRQKFMEGIWRR